MGWGACGSLRRNLLSKQDGTVVDISGRRVLPDRTPTAVSSELPSATAIAALTVDFPTLTERTERSGNGEERRVTVFDESAQSKQVARAAIEALRPGAPDRSAVPAANQLWVALEPLEWVRTLQARLHEDRAVRVDAVARDLFPAASDDVRKVATYKVLGLLALARETPTGLPLLPVRLHAIARGPHGIYACVNPSCDDASVPGRLGALFTDPVGRCSCGGLACELCVCEACGQSFLIATRGVDDEGLPALQAFGAREVDLYVSGRVWDDGTAIDTGDEIHVYTSGEGSGRIASDGEGHPMRRFPGGRPVGPTRRLVGVSCPRCDARLPSGSILRRIESGTDAALQVLIDGLYPQLPEHKDAEKKKLRGGGRRALLFADNRQIAAALAAKVEESHDLLLSRVILTQSLGSASDGAPSSKVERLQAELTRLLVAKGPKEQQERVLAELQAEAARSALQGVGFDRLVRAVAEHPGLPQLSEYDPDMRQALATMIVARELGRRPARTGNLEANGIIAVEYTLELPRPSHPDVAAAFDASQWRPLVEVLLDVSRTSGIVALPDIAEPYDESVARNRHNKLLVKETPRSSGDDDDEDDDRQTVALIPAPQVQSRRLEYLNKVLGRMNVPPTVLAHLVLAQVWESLVAASKADGSSLKLETGERVLAAHLPMTRLRFRLAEGSQAWRCPVCCSVWARQAANACPTAHCAGVLVATEGAPLDPRDRLVALAHSTEPLLGMSTEEHTAQIGTDDLEDFEQRFRTGQLNVLVCSTTMELGIDIGGLSATMLTNVPPSPSNYLQRAGRAGRRAEGTSLVLTFARPRPFDQAAFEEPDRPFNERIVPPRVRLDSRRIVQRHANALLLAHFFRRYRAQSDQMDPMSALRTVGEFFDVPVATVLAGSPELGELAKDTGIAPAEATLSDAFVAWVGAALEENKELVSTLSNLVAGTALESDPPGAAAQRAGTDTHRAARNVRDQLRILRDEREAEATKPRDKQDEGRLHALTLQEKDLTEEKLLGYLAEEQFLPRYGFPVQVVPLHDSYQVVRSADRDSKKRGRVRPSSLPRHCPCPQRVRTRGRRRRTQARSPFEWPRAPLDRQRRAGRHLGEVRGGL